MRKRVSVSYIVECIDVLMVVTHCLDLFMGEGGGGG